MAGIERLAAEREKIRRLQRECMRLSRALSQERSKGEELRLLVSATMGSLTWRLAAAANALLTKVLRLGRGPAAWQRLNVLLSEPQEQIRKRTDGSSRVAPALHGEAACNAVGLSRLDQAPADGRLLVVSDGATLPFPLPMSAVQCGTDLPALAQCDDCRGLLLLADARTGLHDVEMALVAAQTLEIPTAVWLADASSDAQHAAAEFDFVASPGDIEDGQAILDVLHWNRWLGELYSRGSTKSADIPFSESAYLSSNPDVREAIECGDFASARDHWDFIGQQEFIDGSRPYSLRQDQPSLGLRHADPALRLAASNEIAQWDARPLISILVPVYRVELKWLQACVESVVKQIYPLWQLCLVDDGSGDPAISDYLNGLDDDRIRVKLLAENQGIAAASNHALGLADGEFIGLLDHDDELTVDALWLVARVIHRHDPDLVYSDEAKLDLDGNVVEAHFKPDFSLPMILSQNYISHLGVYRKFLVDKIGGFRSGVEGSQDHDLLLRFLDQASTVFHLPRVLYYWRKVPHSTASRFAEKDYAWDNGLKAIRQSARGSDRAVKGPYPGTYRVDPPLVDEPSVTIIIPFRDQPELLSDCLDSIVARSRYGNYRILCVDNQSEQDQTRRLIDRWQKHEKLSFLSYDAPFNFSAINNFAAHQCKTEHLLLLNNDITVVDENWLEALVCHSRQPATGAVGGLLLYPDQTIQHAGVILGIGGVAGHSHKHMPVTHHGYFCRPHLTQNVSAVTGACLMVKTELFLRVGGLDEQNLAIAFNDIDFCLRLREWGYENVYTPGCRLIHHESKSRGLEDTPEKQRRFNSEANFMRKRHGLALCQGDKYYNPNLTLVHENFAHNAAPQPAEST